MVTKLRIGPWMKREIVSTLASTSVREAAALLVDKRVGTLPVVDEEGALIGITCISDIVRIFLPDFVSLMEDIDFVKDFGARDNPTEGDWERIESLSVADIMEEPVSVEEDCSVLRAISVMDKHNLRDMPVVNDGRLVGIVSRVDVGRAFLTTRMKAMN